MSWKCLDPDGVEKYVNYGFLQNQKKYLVLILIALSPQDIYLYLFRVMTLKILLILNDSRKNKIALLFLILKLVAL